MAVNNFNLPFDVQNIQEQPIRNRPSKYAKSDLAKRARFEVSEGVRPAEYVSVFRNLPVLEKDIATEDYTVVPKGRIISILSTEDAIPTGGMTTPTAEGSVFTFNSAITGAAKSVGIDASYFGYDEYINGLIVPCNGGVESTLFYTSLDVEADTLKSDGTKAAAGQSVIIPANAPVGVAFTDWFQDIRGKYLNYRMWADGGNFLCDWFVEVPYVKIAGARPLIDPRADAADEFADALAKFKVNQRFAYLAVDSTDVFRPGVFIQSDLIGNYKIQGGADALTQNKTIQTVGRILGIDNRFPKSGLEDVQTYPGSGMPGTETAGLPKFLFDFVVACVEMTGTTPTVEEVYNYVRAGIFGVARINISIA